MSLITVDIVALRRFRVRFRLCHSALGVADRPDRGKLILEKERTFLDDDCWFWFYKLNLICKIKVSFCSEKLSLVLYFRVCCDHECAQRVQHFGAYPGFETLGRRIITFGHRNDRAEYGSYGNAKEEHTNFGRLWNSDSEDVLRSAREMREEHAL